MLPDARAVMVGESPYPHEREAIVFARQNIPDRDPYHLWALLELLDPSSGRLYEIDLLVLGYSALYLIEIKSGPGTYTGDTVDWYRTPPGETRSHYMEPPLRLANLKAKILKNRLSAKMRRPELAPRVEALVFLSDRDTTLKLVNGGETSVILRNQLARAVTHHEFPGSPENWRGRPINLPAATDIAQALKAIGIRPRKAQLHAGSYELRETLQDGPGYQDRVAVHRGNPRIKARARTYLVPAETSIERKQQLLRAADREASLLYAVREHPHVLTYTDYVTDAPLGPTVLLEAFEGSQPLGAFLRASENAELRFEDRVEIVVQVGRALAHCHRRGVIHGALSPDAILVRRNADDGDHALETRLFSFQLGRGDAVESTRHFTALVADRSLVYQAPELRLGSASATEASDIYGLGAVAHLVFTGRPPGETLQEVDARLKRSGKLDPCEVSGSLSQPVAEWIEAVTAAAPIERESDITGWIEILVGEARSLAAPTSEEISVDPLHAKKDDTLEGGFIVEKVLGHGATSRVLQALSPETNNWVALKVSLNAEHDARLRREGELLRSLRHEHIVACLGERTIHGRTCLLLDLAGQTTLDRDLAAEGTVSLEYASRYGEDLLSALQALEDRGVLHRDIKPANLGVRAVGRSAHHLTLFDFSLLDAPLSDIRVGTAPYRDPYLSARGAWDHAADRWSAAITLHEMLTGVRPAFRADANPVDPSARVELSAERLDASVREAMSGFFERALHPAVERRFSSADEMKRKWLLCFEAPRPLGISAPTPGQAVPELSDEIIAAITAQTLVGELPIGPRARNALERAGLTMAADLLRLPDNRLSAIRGVGAKVAKEIFGFRRRWQALSGATPADASPFWPGYRGEDRPLEHAALPIPVRQALEEAGFSGLQALADEPKEQLTALLQRHQVDPDAIREVLRRFEAEATDQSTPASLDDWLALLLGGRSKPERQMQAMLGLQAPFVGRLDVEAREVADHFGLQTTAAIYQSHRKCRERWSALDPLKLLSERCRDLLSTAGGALRHDEAGRAILAVLPHDPTTAPDMLAARAVALWRIVADVDQDRAAQQDESALDGQVRFVRVPQGDRKVGWFVQHLSQARVLEGVGRAADALAARSVIAAPSEVERELAPLVASTSFEHTAPGRLTELAALASTKAARSAALELYPHQMEARRALDLSAAVLTGELEPEEVRRRVHARYPDAQPLPQRPDLDALLQTHGLLWNEAKARYSRPDVSASSSIHTRFGASSGFGPTALRLEGAKGEEDSDDRATGVQRPLIFVTASAPSGPGPQIVAAREFDDALREALDRAQFRVLTVSADKAPQAALALATRLATEPVLLDQRIASEMKRLLQADGDPDALYAIDADGPASGQDWHELTQLAAEAAALVATSLLPPTSPLLLVQPGLIARYTLDGFVKALADAAEDPHCAAILLLVPVHGTPSGLPVINGTYRLSHMRHFQHLRVPRAWIDQHAAIARAASAPSRESSR